MIRRVVFRGIIILCAVVVSFTLSPCQSKAENVQDDFALSFRGGVFLNNQDYGSLGAAGVRIPLFSTMPILGGYLFGENFSLQAMVGAGSWYQKSSLTTSINLTSFELQTKVPLLNLSRVTGISRPFWFTVSSVVGLPSMRNSFTLSKAFVLIGGVGVELEASLTDFVNASMEYRWMGVQRKPFLWSSGFEMLSFGLSFPLGGGQTQLNEARHEVSELEATVSELQDTLRSVRRELGKVRGQQNQTDESIVLRREIRTLKEELQALREDLQSEVKRRSGNRNGFEEYETDNKGVLQYNRELLPKMTVVRIRKKLFEKEDLVEEDYLKGILALISNYDQYVWEIAYRDPFNSDRISGRVLAKKLQSFFEIYNSKFKQKLRIEHDESIGTEFEIRCLGQALLQ